MKKINDIIIKRLSIKGYYSINLESITRNVLSFHRTIVHRNDLKKVNKYFKNINVPITKNSILNYPKYMKDLARKGLNPFDFRVIVVAKNTVIETSRIKNWIDQARRFWENT